MKSYPNSTSSSVLSRRCFIGRTGSTALGLLGMGLMSRAWGAEHDGSFLFLEAEGFDDRGGWEIDQQSMDWMGSPYLLAHGLGIPVEDAVTRVEFPSAGRYRMWVRTRDWVAPWDAPGAPGKFQVLIDGKAVEETFGTKGAKWHWHDGGSVEVGEKAEIALHDLTGFEGRCEALLFCKDLDFKPTEDIEALSKFRRKLIGLPEEPEDGGSYDFVVVGGGLAGTSAAVSAARQGLKVALIQDRPVLGGNCSTEVRVWPEGKTCQPPYPHVGEIVEEMLIPLERGPGSGNFNGKQAEYFDDELKEKIVAGENNIKLFLLHRGIRVETGADKKIEAVVIQHLTTGQRLRLTAPVFADCTGDATIGFQAGADFEYNFTSESLMGSTNLFRVLDASDEEQVLGCECKDKASLETNFKAGKTAQAFPRCPWALDLSDKPFPGRAKFSENGKDDLNKFERQWFWESGFNEDQVRDIELIRDHNFRAMYGAWDALKNVDGLYPNHRLEWAAFIAGKRESRRLMGEFVLDAKDVLKGREFPDAAFPCSWHVDLHFPRKEYAEGLKGKEFIADFTRGKGYTYKGVYWAPYRVLYSRNIPNLFMAGRNISVSKSGLGPVRVMRTCGMMGEIIGKAAAICSKKKCSPSGVYHEHLEELKTLMRQPGKQRTV